MEKPRTWILRDGGSGFQALGIVAKGPDFFGHVEVIEHKDYDELIQKTYILQQRLTLLTKYISAVEYLKTCHLTPEVRQGLDNILENK